MTEAIPHCDDHRNGYRGFSKDLGYELAYEGKLAAEAIISEAPHPPLVERDIADGPGAEGNKLIYGDNLGAIGAMMDDASVRGNVRLVYIDPPFGTRLVFLSKDEERAYHDHLDGPDYIDFLRRRLVLIRELMAEDGSIYVHLDNKMAFAIKVVMDEVFGPRNFRNWITRKKSNPKNYTRRSYGNVHDYILFYSKSSKYVFNQPRTERGVYTFEERFPRVEQETGRRYALVPVHARGTRNGSTGRPWRGKMPPKGKHWQASPDKLNELDANGEIHWSSTGNPRRKIYADERPAGVPVQDIWLEFQDERNQVIETTGYPTEKNIDLVRRIVRASSEEGDLVLDCFAGSGTTLVAASEEGRRWIGVDAAELSISTIRSRLSKLYETWMACHQQSMFDDSKNDRFAPGYRYYEVAVNS